VANNVLKFLDECSEEIGKHESIGFHQEIWNDFIELNIESPIEQLLYCALKAIQKFNLMEDDEPVQDKDGIWYVRGLYIGPQYRIDNYRVDFKISWGSIHGYTRDQGIQLPRMMVKEIIIECDSQEFHERIENERRYEKIRDRHLLKKGYKVMHFTGKEITDHALKVAAEIIAYLTDSDINNISLNGGWE